MDPNRIAKTKIRKTLKDDIGEPKILAPGNANI